MTALRDYQRDAVRAVYAAARAGEGRILVVLPTGAGKTHVIGRIAADCLARGQRALVVAHRAELLLQAEEKLAPLVAAGAVGVNSAKLGRRDHARPVVLCSINSVYRRPERLGERRLIIIDECHLIPRAATSMYQALLAAYPAALVVGLTATPYRLDHGLIYGPEKCVFSRVAHTADLAELIRAGYLCPVRSQMPPGAQIDTSRLRVRQGEFAAAEMEAAAMAAEIAADMILRADTTGRRSILVFASGIEHGQSMAQQLADAGQTVGQVYGHTPFAERQELYARFLRRELRWLVNCAVLTIGFDAPIIDGVVLARPTLSPGLYYQMVGRGFRMAPGKALCQVLDYGGNIKRHGPLDWLGDSDMEGIGSDGQRKKPERPKGWICDECGSVSAWPKTPGDELVCSSCGSVKEERQPLSETTAATADDSALVAGAAVVEVRHEFFDWYWKPHVSKANGAESLMVSYSAETYEDIGREWLGFWRDGFFGQKSREWWDAAGGSLPYPANAAEAVGRRREVSEPLAVVIKRTRGEKYPRVRPVWPTAGERKISARTEDFLRQVSEAPF